MSSTENPFPKPYLYKSPCKQSFFSPKISPLDIIEAHPPYEQEVLGFCLTGFTDQKVYKGS
jgi:hypothetical protein